MWLMRCRRHSLTWKSSGIGFGVYQHRYDALTWPHATAGFFKLKKQIPEIAAELGLK
jgi:deoxyribodipyrimidine photo-lyase